MTNGTNLIEKFRDQARAEGKSMFIGPRWLNGHVVGYGIWIYGPKEHTKTHPPVASAMGLDELYGRN